jgi:hypothetical protein
MESSLKEILFKNCIPVPESGCWLWLGKITSSHGYALMRIAGEDIYAHRVSHELYKGPIPEGWHTDHLCRVHCCVNPDHLEAVPPEVNWMRGESPTVKFARAIYCKRGHLLTPENLWHVATRPNVRICKICGNGRRNSLRKGVRPSKRRTPCDSGTMAAGDVPVLLRDSTGKLIV